jgi:hypothetical protein
VQGPNRIVLYKTYANVNLTGAERGIGLIVEGLSLAGDNVLNVAHKLKGQSWSW